MEGGEGGLLFIGGGYTDDREENTGAVICISGGWEVEFWEIN